MFLIFWDVYPEVLMALAHNSWEIKISSNCLEEKSQKLFLDASLKKVNKKSDVQKWTALDKCRPQIHKKIGTTL